MAGIFKAYDIRGIYPEQLNEATAEKIGRAFVQFLGAKKVVVGRDMRPHSLPIFNALAKGMTIRALMLLISGCALPPCHIMPTGNLVPTAA